MNQIILSGIQITISIWEMWMCYEILYMTVLDKKYADKKETIIRWANIFVVGSLLGINRLIAFFSRTMLGLVVILTIMCMYGIKRKKVVLSAGIVFVYFEFIAILDFILAFISMEFIKEQFEHVIYIYALTWQKVLIYFFTRGIILLGIVNIKKREESIRSMIEQCCGIIVITGALLCAVLFKYQLWLDEMANGSKEVGGTGSGEGEFISPSAITMCNEKIYVLDQGNNRIQVLDKELDYIEEIKLKNTQSTDPNYIPEVLSVNQESIYVTGVSLENPVVDKYTDGKLKEIGSNFIGSIYSCNNQIYLINSMVRYYDEANDSFGALTSCPEWLMTIKDNKLKKLCELPDGLNISSFLLTDRGIICVSCAGAAVYRLSENGKYEETITYIDGLEDEEIPQISINEKEEYFIVMPNARKIFKCFKGEN